MMRITAEMKEKYCATTQRKVDEMLALIREDGLSFEGGLALTRLRMESIGGCTLSVNDEEGEGVYDITRDTYPYATIFKLFSDIDLFYYES
tara:strand:- start:1175 stop:1447 length:273 start_codon:yes stop_codon:yes gene_type:complete